MMNEAEEDKELSRMRQVHEMIRDQLLLSGESPRMLATVPEADLEGKLQTIEAKANRNWDDVSDAYDINIEKLARMGVNESVSLVNSFIHSKVVMMIVSDGRILCYWFNTHREATKNKNNYEQYLDIIDRYDLCPADGKIDDAIRAYVVAKGCWICESIGLRPRRYLVVDCDAYRDQYLILEHDQLLGVDFVQRGITDGLVYNTRDRLYYQYSD